VHSTGHHSKTRKNCNESCLVQQVFVICVFVIAISIWLTRFNSLSVVSPLLLGQWVYPGAGQGCIHTRNLCKCLEAKFPEWVTARYRCSLLVSTWSSTRSAYLCPAWFAPGQLARFCGCQVRPDFTKVLQPPSPPKANFVKSDFRKTNTPEISLKSVNICIRVKHRIPLFPAACSTNGACVHLWGEKTRNDLSSFMKQYIQY